MTTGVVEKLSYDRKRTQRAARYSRLSSSFRQSHPAPLRYSARSTNMQNVNPRVMGRLNKELRQLASNPPEGVRFLPGDCDTLTEVHAELDGPGE